MKWTYEICKKEALKCQTRSEFAKFNSTAYKKSHKNNWIDDICSHMIIVGNNKKRCVYVYEFDNNHAYIGLTYNFIRRWNNRLNDDKDTVNIFMKETNLTPNKIQLTSYISEKEAIDLEKFYLDEYLNNNWVILNKVKTGSLGGNILKWTYEICEKEVCKYDSIKEFKDNNINCLSAIYKNNWGELLDVLNREKNKNNYWTKDKCLEVALLCKNKLEFHKNYRGAYASSKLNNWIDDIFLLVNLNTRKSSLYYEISDELFNEILLDKTLNNLSIEKLSKKYKIGIQKLSKKFKEKN